MIDKILNIHIIAHYAVIKRSTLKVLVDKVPCDSLLNVKRKSKSNMYDPIYDRYILADIHTKGLMKILNIHYPVSKVEFQGGFKFFISILQYFFEFSSIK